jgi:hypothetical protein
MTLSKFSCNDCVSTRPRSSILSAGKMCRLKVTGETPAITAQSEIGKLTGRSEFVILG